MNCASCWSEQNHYSINGPKEGAHCSKINSHMRQNEENLTYKPQTKWLLCFMVQNKHNPCSKSEIIGST